MKITLDCHGMIQAMKMFFEDILWESNPNYWLLALAWIPVTISCWLHVIIIGYLYSKSPGQQSVMDTANIFFLKIAVIQRGIFTFYVTITIFTEDSGELLALILGWSLYNAFLCFLTSIIVIALVQSFLVFWPRAMGADGLESVINLGLWCVPITNVCISILFFSLGSSPDTYNVMRGIEKDGELSLCSKYRNGIAMVSLLTLLSSRIAIGIWDGGICCSTRMHQRSQHILSNGVLLMGTLFLTIHTTILLISHQLHGPDYLDRAFLSSLIAAGISLAFPTYIVLGNLRVRNYAFRKTLQPLCPGLASKLMHHERGSISDQARPVSMAPASHSTQEAIIIRGTQDTNEQCVTTLEMVHKVEVKPRW